MRRVISEANGVQQILHVDAADPYRGSVELTQDVEGVLAEVRRARDAPQGREFRKMAEVPMAVYLQACVEGWANDPAAWKRWANDPDNAAFRVAPGRL